MIEFLHINTAYITQATQLLEDILMLRYLFVAVGDLTLELCHLFSELLDIGLLVHSKQSVTLCYNLRTSDLTTRND